MKKQEAKQLKNRDEVILKKTFDGSERVLKICGDIKEQSGEIIVDLFDDNGCLVLNVSHKYLK